MAEKTDEALRLVEAERHQYADPDLEAQLSINEWGERLRGMFGQAHHQARTPGLEDAQRQTWVEIAALAVARIETLLP